MPSMQYVNQNRQSSWKTNRLISSHDYILLNQVLHKLNVLIVDQLLPFFFRFSSLTDGS